MHNILLAAVRLDSEAAARKGSRKYVLLHDEKSLEKFQQRSSFLVRAQWPAILIKMNLITGIFQ